MKERKRERQYLCVPARVREGERVVVLKREKNGSNT